METEFYGTEVFLVCQNRQDKHMPSIAKTCDEKMHLVIESAEEHLKRLQEEIGPHYGIYRALIEVTNRVK